MSMPTTDGMANSVMSRGMEGRPHPQRLSSPADEARNRSPRGSPAAWRPRQARARPAAAPLSIPRQASSATHAFAPFFSSALL